MRSEIINKLLLSGVVLVLHIAAFTAVGAGVTISVGTPAQWQALASDPNALTGTIIITADINLAGKTVVPVGSAKDPFLGIVNGQGHVISHAGISQIGVNCVGLFGYIGSGARISDLVVESVNITGTDYVGALAGYAYMSEIVNCKSTGIVQGRNNVGGLVGQNEGLISGSYSEVAVLGTTAAGGLVGNNYGLSAILKACYCSSQVTAQQAGGLAGLNTGLAYSCFWNKNLVPGSPAGKGLTLGELTNALVFARAGWGEFNWKIADGIGQPRLNFEPVAGFPVAAAPLPPLAGDGTEALPYIIASASDLLVLTRYSSVLDKHIMLTSDIDMSGITFEPIGLLGPFSGDFNGGGHVIRNITILTIDDYAGLFSTIYNGQISKLGLAAIKVSGNNFVGGIAGRNYQGNIKLCFVSGSVKGNWYVGSLAGCSTMTGQ